MMHRFILLALLVAQCASAETISPASSPSTSSISSHQQRRELYGFTDLWYTILNSLHVHCPHDSTEEHPTGHCAHPSHHHHNHKPSGGSGGGSHSSSSSSSNPCTDDCTEDNEEGCGCEVETEEKVWEDDGHTDDTTEEVEWEDDGHTDDTTETAAVWDDDGHTDDTTETAAVWDDDGHTDDTTDDNNIVADWDDDGWSDDTTTVSSVSYAKSSLNYRTQSNGGGGSGSGKKWAIGAGVIGLVGIGALVASKKRKHSDEENNVPGSIYMQDLGEPVGKVPAIDEGSIEMKSVGGATTMTRAQSIKSAISKRSQSFKNRFSRSRSAQNNNVGAYSPPTGALFDHESIASNEQMHQEDGGVAM